MGVVLCVLKYFKWKLHRCISWLIFEVILRNARSNDEIHVNKCNFTDKDQPKYPQNDLSQW